MCVCMCVFVCFCSIVVDIKPIHKYISENTPDPLYILAFILILTLQLRNVYFRLKGELKHLT